MEDKGVVDLGRLNFEAYRASVGGKTHYGADIPAWEDLTEAVRTGWRAGATAVEKIVSATYEAME